MKALLQRVSQASVSVDGQVVSSIGPGLLVLLGVERGDREEEAETLARKVVEYRVFEDEAGKMNRSLAETGGEMLVVSQFTLCADTKKGRRPSFDPAAPPELAQKLYLDFVAAVRKAGIRAGIGSFGASMRVSLINEGPVTFLLDQKNPSGFPS